MMSNPQKRNILTQIDSNSANIGLFIEPPKSNGRCDGTAAAFCAAFSALLIRLRQVALENKKRNFLYSPYIYRCTHQFGSIYGVTLQSLFKKCLVYSICNALQNLDRVEKN